MNEIAKAYPLFAIMSRGDSNIKFAYSSLSNDSIEWNNSVRWQISPNLIIVQDGIRFCRLDFFKKKE